VFDAQVFCLGCTLTYKKKSKRQKERIMAFQLSNGHVMEYVVACALGFDGRGMWHEKWLKPLHLLTPSLFTVVTKTLTYQPGGREFSVV
jgi:hypothetical protein